MAENSRNGAAADKRAEADESPKKTQENDGGSGFHPEACIDPGARVHKTARIGAGAVVGMRVVIREDVTVEAGVSIRGRVEIGRGTTVERGAGIKGPREEDPGEPCRIGTDVRIGPCAEVEGPVEIRDGAAIEAEASAVCSGNGNCVIGGGARIGEFAHVEDSWIGHRAAVKERAELEGSATGKYSLVAPDVRLRNARIPDGFAAGKNLSDVREVAGWRDGQERLKLNRRFWLIQSDPDGFGLNQGSHGMTMREGDVKIRSGSKAPGETWPEHFEKLKPVIHPSASVADGTAAACGVVIDREAAVEEGVVLDVDAAVGPKAFIGENAEIGAGSRIGAETRIGAGAKLGHTTTVEAGAAVRPGEVTGPGAVIKRIAEGARVAPDAEIDPTARIGKDAVIGEGVWIGPETDVRSGAEIGAGTVIRGDCVIGVDTVVGEYAVIGTGTAVGPRCRIGARTRIEAGTKIDENAVIGERASIKRCRIGAGAMVAPHGEIARGAVIREDGRVTGPSTSKDEMRRTAAAAAATTTGELL